MSTPPLMHDRAYFTEMYADDPDPWKFDTSWYERRKFAVTIAALPRERYRRAFEPGCANGALTALLADRCHELVAGDVIPAVVTHARERLAGASHVEVRRAEFPIDWPDG